MPSPSFNPCACLAPSSASAGFPRRPGRVPCVACGSSSGASGHHHDRDRRHGRRRGHGSDPSSVAAPVPSSSSAAEAAAAAGGGRPGRGRRCTRPPARQRKPGRLRTGPAGPVARPPPRTESGAAARERSRVRERATSDSRNGISTASHMRLIIGGDFAARYLVPSPAASATPASRTAAMIRMA